MSKPDVRRELHWLEITALSTEDLPDMHAEVEEGEVVDHGAAVTVGALMGQVGEFALHHYS